MSLGEMKAKLKFTSKLMEKNEFNTVRLLTFENGSQAIVRTTEPHNARARISYRVSVFVDGREITPYHYCDGVTQIGWRELYQVLKEISA